MDGRNLNNAGGHALKEFAAWVAAFIVLVFSLRSMLISGSSTLTHDNFYWYYPVFQYFAENIINGNYPLWNPFTHAGEPFYPLLFQFRLLDPLTVLTIYLGGFLTDDIVLIFNWNRMVQSMLMVSGMYLVLRSFARHLIIKLSLIPILLFSSVMLASFRQDAVINQFLYAPFILYFLLRILYYGDRRWRNYLLASVLIGLNWQSYMFSGVSILLLFFSAGLLAFKRDLLADLARSKGIRLKIAVSVCVMVVMMAPNVVLLYEKDEFVYPARMVDLKSEKAALMPTGGAGQFQLNETLKSSSSIKMPYEMIMHSGTFAQIWNFIQIISPDGNEFVGWPIFMGKKMDERGDVMSALTAVSRWGTPSEAFVYIGMLPWAVVLLGMVAGLNDQKRVWAVLCVGFALLMLGPSGGLHYMLYHLYPPLWFFRHTHALVLFFTFTLLYFYVLGANHLYLTWRAPLFSSASSGQNAIVRRAGAATDTAAFASVAMAVIVILNMMAAPVESGYKQLLPYIAFAMAMFWLMRRYVSPSGLFFGLLAGHSMAVVLFTENPFFFILYLTAAAAIPVCIYFYVKRMLASPLASSSGKTASYIVVALALLAAGADLYYGFAQSRYLYAHEKSPRIALGIDTSAQAAKPRLVRSIAPPRYTYNTDQAMRYLSLVYRAPFVFSPLMDAPYYHGVPLPEKLRGLRPETFEYALRSVKWNSFLLTQKYYELISSSIAPGILEKMFAVGRPVFQYKKGAVVADDADIEALLKGLGNGGSIELLGDYALLNVNDAALYDGLKINAKDYRRDSKAGRNSTGEGFSFSVGEYGYNKMLIKVNSQAPGILYWSDGYDDWWRAEINGVESPVLRANLNFKALALHKGENIIRLQYEPVLFIYSLWIYYGVFGMVMLIVGLSYMKNKFFGAKAS